MTYYFRRFNLTFTNWMYWMTTPHETLQDLTSPYNVRNLYWSITENGRTVATNFWYMLNDGYYDMIEEYYDT